MNKVVKKVQKLSDKELSKRIMSLAKLQSRKWDDAWLDMNAIEDLKESLEGSRSVPPTGQVALYFDALLAVTRGEVLAIFATPRQCAEAWYLAKTYKPE